MEIAKQNVRAAFVTKIDGRRDRVELDTDPQALLCERFFLRKWKTGVLPGPGEYEVQIRYRSRPVPCTVTAAGENFCEVRPRIPLRAVTPGQIGALYRGEELLGGGIITMGEEDDDRFPGGTGL